MMRYNEEREGQLEVRTSLARLRASARPSHDEMREIGLNELSWRTYTPCYVHILLSMYTHPTRGNVKHTLWLVRRLSTCFSQHATQISLQINLMASKVSVKRVLSLHNLKIKVCSVRSLRRRMEFDLPLSKVCADM